MSARTAGRWTQSIVFDLVLSAIAGVTYAWFALNPVMLHPGNVSWLDGDAVNYYAGWGMFRQDSHWHWPLTFTDRIGYPVGETLAVLDAIPLLALPLRLLSGLLPAPFQYFGIASTLACVLQFFFALRLFRFLIGSRLIPLLLSASFLLLSPVLAMRLPIHYSLTNQWLIPAAFLVFAKAVSRRNPSRFSALVLPGLALAACAAAINPYLAMMTLGVLACAAVSLFLLGRVSALRALAAIGCLAATGLSTAWVVGLVAPGAAGMSTGFREYSMNLLSPINPAPYGARLLPNLPLMGVPQQEGYGYFGAGLLALAVIVIPFALRRIRFNRTLAAQVGPLLAVSGLFTLFALSTKITAGSSVLVDLDPQGTVSALFNPLRASGRFFWVAYYAVFVGAIAACFRLWRAWVAVAIVAAALVVQFADGARERRWMHRVVSTEHSSPFHSPFWATAGKRYRHLVVLPAGQCGLETPDGAEGFRDFGLLAVAQRMTINSYSAGRYSEASIDYQCDRAVLQAVSRPLDPESLYVVTPPIAEQIERGAGHCRTVDGFFVCSAETRDH